MGRCGVWLKASLQESSPALEAVSRKKKKYGAKEVFVDLEAAIQSHR